MGCDHGGLPGVGNAQFEFDVDARGQLWADLTAIDGVSDKEIHVDYGKCGILGEAHCSMPPTINAAYRFESYAKRQFASSYQFACFREKAKGDPSIDADVIQKNSTHFPSKGTGYDYSGNSATSCQSTCAVDAISLTTAAMQMSVACGCTGCGVTKGFDSASMNYCSGRTSGAATANDLCRPPKGFQNASNGNVTDTNYYQTLDKHCKNTYLYPYDDQNSTTQCSIATNPKIKITIRDQGRCHRLLHLILLILLGILVAGISTYVTRKRLTSPLWSRGNARPILLAVLISGAVWFVLTIPASRVAKTTWWFWSDCSNSHTTTCEYSKVALGLALGICAALIGLLAYSLYQGNAPGLPTIRGPKLFILVVLLSFVCLLTVSAVVKKKWFIWQRSCP